MARVRWTDRARRDLLSVAWLDGREGAEGRLERLARIREELLRAADAPLAGDIVEELGREEVREVFLEPYRLVYRIHGGGIDVVTVSDCIRPGAL
ncbi:MAG: type II toxin-antitoxin system RelE/ParE family toxin [Planctomycetota bacterium]